MGLKEIKGEAEKIKEEIDDLIHKHTHETQKRLAIVKGISSQLEKIAEGIMLGGSMGYGQYHSVTKKSDIDLVVVVNLTKIKDLKATEYFKELKQDVLDLFNEKVINFYLDTRRVNNVETNVVLYESKGYIDFCLLKKGLRGFIFSRPEDVKENYGFDGKIVKANTNALSSRNGFIYEKPVFAEGKYYAVSSRYDFLYSYKALFGEDSFIGPLEKLFWSTAIKRLVEEYPNPDLSKTNMLNTHFVYQKARKRIPKEIIEKIKERTKLELTKLQQS